MTRLIAIVALLLGLCLAGTLDAGQGPQNVLVVINQRSPASLAVGHYYVRLRNIPPANVIYLDWSGSPVATDIETFRERILKPIVKTIDDRKLTPHITTVAYSTDFPYVIDFSGDIKADSPIDARTKQHPQGSLTGLTYLGSLVLAKDVRYAALDTNFYYRPSFADKLLAPTRTSAPLTTWTPQGEPDNKNGLRYLMAIMLAYTSGRGNSLDEVEHYLRSSLVADGTYPAGKVLFMKNGDIRAKTREPHFRSAIERLEMNGVTGAIAEGILPQEQAGIIGAMLGTVDYRFKDSGSTLRGGAIVENLTSFGGVMHENGGQTALSECLRAGAAGSSGTVTEPFAIQAKFPHPMLHAHYAAGCTLVEAFYQAVQGPYQLLIVGDPLARPWAKIPTVRVAGLPHNRVVSGTLKLHPAASIADRAEIAKFELYVDGRLATQCPAGHTLDVDSRAWADGYHELRVVAYEQSLIATQGDWIVPITSANYGWELPTLVREGSEPLTLDGEVTVKASSPGSQGLVLYHNQRMLGALTAEAGTWRFPCSVLGPGKTSLLVLAARGNAPVHTAFSLPLEINIESPLAIAKAAASGELRAGLKLSRADQPAQYIERLADDWLTKAGIKPGEAFTLEGKFETERGGSYQVQCEFQGEVTVEVDGAPMLDEFNAIPAWRFGLVKLTPGTHTLKLRAKLKEYPRLTVLFGDQGAQIVTGERFKSLP